jgi:hypothetical protein
MEIFENGCIGRVCIWHSMETRRHPHGRNTTIRGHFGGYMHNAKESYLRASNYFFQSN